ncbi:uncharacterized protein LOC107039240 [Diachasma alloeum]|uniref:uncharacterized protein LOC107039240 n=1 Tax=Diachasma alloeum TaxID=454923 RepID=UPI000738465E|nr:uncharacterized protein LOC107039240 [Diachasma alloeum]
MNESETNDSPPSQDGALAKKVRTSSDTTNSITLHLRGCDLNLRIEDMNSRNSLSHMEQTNTRLNQIRERRRNLCEEKRRILVDRVESSKQTIKDLTIQLSETAKSIREAREAQTAAKSQISKDETNMQQKILELQNKNAQLEEVIAQRTTDDALKQYVKNQMMELLNTCTPSQKDIYLKKAAIRKGKLKIEELESEKIYLRKEIQDLLPQAAGAEKLERKLLLANEVISKIRTNAVESVGPGVEASSVSEELGDEISAQEHLVDITSECLKSRLHETEETVCQMASEAPVPEICDLTSATQAAENVYPSLSSNQPGQTLIELSDDESVWSPQRLQEDHRIRVGKYYFLASHPKYFKINWEKEYGRRGPAFSCRWCASIIQQRVAVIDHIWVKHYGGRYKCPLCLDPPYFGASRYQMSNHVKLYHI